MLDERVQRVKRTESRGRNIGLPPNLYPVSCLRPHAGNALVLHRLNASSIRSNSSGISSSLLFLPFLSPFLSPSLFLNPPAYISEYLAKKPGWFQRCNVPENMALLESLSRLRMLRRVTDLQGKVVPASRMLRDWKKQVTPKAFIFKRQRRTAS